MPSRGFSKGGHHTAVWYGVGHGTRNCGLPTGDVAVEWTGLPPATPWTCVPQLCTLPLSDSPCVPENDLFDSSPPPPCYYSSACPQVPRVVCPALPFPVETSHPPGNRTWLGKVPQLSDTSVAQDGDLGATLGWGTW